VQASASQASHVAASRPKPPGWFPGGFAQAESTFTDEGIDASPENPGRRTEWGYDFGYSLPFPQHNTKDSRWFAETPSAGDEQAWQTFYPPVKGSLAGNRHITNPTWVSTPVGWVEEYNSAEYGSKPGRKRPDWFDTRILNIDGFGRPKLPDPSDARRSLDTGYSNESWIERSVNTTLECAEIGCTASASLFAFDPNSEEHHNCRLSIAVHATDFENDFGNEYIANLLVNGYVVRPQCEPMAGGCSNASQIPLYSCVNGYSIDHLENGTGTFAIQGTLGPMVDECPYNGNLLAGVVVATCLVRNRVEQLPLPSNAAIAGVAGGAAGGAAGRLTAAEERETLLVAQYANATLSCSSPGCTAAVLLNVNPFIALAGGTCSMNITMISTDFDDDLGVVEQVDFVELSGQGVVAENVTSGVNPCTSRLQGHPLSPEEIEFALVSNLEVTEAVRHPPAGSMTVSVKISEFVDECATANGNLLEATVFVRCDPPENISSITTVPNPGPGMLLQAVQPRGLRLRAHGGQ
jgi:hypothetical protein